MKQMRSMLASVAFCAAILSACSDSTAPGTRSIAAVDAASGRSQSGIAGTAVAETPSVRVTDSQGAGVAGVRVQFEVVTGGGSVGTPVSTTDRAGVASAGTWILGDAGVNELVGHVERLEPVTFTANASPAPGAGDPVDGDSTPPVEPTPPVTQSAFEIEVRYISAATERQKLAVERAVDRWRSVIIADLADIPVRSAANTCFAGQPELAEAVDDLLLFVDFSEIDGPGQVLGMAGPCLIRSVSSLPIIGFLNLDAADLMRMEAEGTLDDVVLHEIGHVLGIGTLWSMVGMVSGAGSSDPLYTGGSALAAYRGFGGVQVGVPIENTGSTGTRESHWRESVFGNELMTGYIRGTPNPLSALTIASLVDLGYGATQSAASSYTLGGLIAGLRSGEPTVNVLREPLELHRHERVLRPKYRVDGTGRKVPIPADSF